MPDPTAQRTLVKSPPELWAEVSDAGALAKHLGEFGEIRITRLEPETTVAWEGDRASGTVKLEPSGWGTKVTLTATAVEVEAPEPEPVVEAVEPEPEPEPEPTPTAAVEEKTEPEVEEKSWLDRHPPEEPGPRIGFWKRLFGRRPVATPMVAEVLPGPEPTPVPDPSPLPDPPAPDPSPPVPAPDPEPPSEPDPTPEPQIAAVLTSALDNLGSAHHRPFSRG